MFEVSGSPSVSVLVRAVVDAAAALLDAAGRAGTWEDAERAAALSGLARVAGLVAAARGPILAAERDAGTSVRPGDRSFADARARATGAGFAAVLGEVRQADTLTAMPTLARAVGDGVVPVGQLEVIARRAAAAPHLADVLASPAGQDRLVAMARRQSVPELDRALRELAAAHDPNRLEDGHGAQRRARFLRLTHREDGTRITGLLDAVSGHVLQLALDCTRQAPDDDRDRGQALADALVAVATHANACPTNRVDPDPGAELDAPDGSLCGVSARPHVSLLMSVDTLAELRRTTRARHTHTHTHPDVAAVEPFRPVPPATLEDGTPVPMSEVARILCDCEVTRIAVDAAGTPLDVGRTARRYTGALRRAVVARDRGCGWHGCHTPARYGEVHHIRWWDRDHGPTSLANGVLLCEFHHHVVHQHDLTIQRLPPPDGPTDRRRQRPGSAPRRRAAYRFLRRDGSPMNEPPPGPDDALDDPDGAVFGDAFADLDGAAVFGDALTDQGAADACGHHFADSYAAAMRDDVRRPGPGAALW